jgi:glycosyltransferase involved in cell wall biosynthesis
MRICITRSNKYSYSETFIRNQINGLAKQAEVYTLYGGWLPEFRENGKLLNSWPYWLLNKIYKNIFRKGNNYFGNYGVSQFLKANKIDVVLANYGLGGVRLLPVCRKLHLPLVVHFHGFDAAHIPTLKKYGPAYLEMFSYASAIIAVSDDMARQLIGLGASADKVHTIACGIDPGKFTPGDPSKAGRDFIAVGRLAPKKAPYNSILAFKKVLASFPDATLTMVGAKEEMYTDCLELTRELGLEDKVIFTGRKTPEEIVPLLHRSRAFIQHSVKAPDGDSEGTPNAVLEASVSGLPVVSTLHAGIKEAVIHGKTGYLVPENDIAGMAEYMKLLAADPLLAAQLGQNGRKYMIEAYDLEKQIHKLYTVISAVVNKTDN